MTFYCNGEPIARVDDVELEGVDVSDLKVWKDETFTAEVDTSGWSKEQWYTILGVIPVILCKYCVHFDGYYCHNKHWGDGYGNYTPPIKKEDGFCDWAERKENE